MRESSKFSEGQNDKWVDTELIIKMHISNKLDSKQNSTFRKRVHLHDATSKLYTLLKAACVNTQRQKEMNELNQKYAHISGFPLLVKTWTSEKKNTITFPKNSYLFVLHIFYKIEFKPFSNMHFFVTWYLYEDPFLKLDKQKIILCHESMTHQCHRVYTRAPNGQTSIVSPSSHSLCFVYIYPYNMGPRKCRENTGNTKLQACIKALFCRPLLL